MSSRLAIEGGEPVRRAPYPPWPVLGEEDEQAVGEVLRSGRLTSLTGGTVAQFEAEFARYHGIKHCVAASSGTTAIHLALAAAGISAGDEVIVPTHTFIASATPILHQGAVPVFADVEADTFNVSRETIEPLLTPRTKAIIAVHLNGHPAAMDGILRLAQDRGLVVVEDAAQAHGALYQGRKVGTIGRMGCFSFWEDKIMTSGGEGGAVITDDDELAARLRMIRSHGEGPIAGERRYYHLVLGYNYRMPAMQAAVGLVQLRRLEEYLEARRRNAAYLTERLKEVPAVVPPYVAPYAVHSYYKYICRLRTDLRQAQGVSVDIERFVAAVAAEGVPISRRYPTPLHRQPVFQKLGYGDVSCPVAERLAGELFILLVHPTVSERDLDDVAAAIGKVAEAYGG
ncbi:MAG: DegT/DnrJ/EryC1/StrS family aminotransferase [Chloroflexota bacterium]|nr:DegT/DnrJ/EryC1/StrS family aminotransferase [Chloroflexota bacterium]